MTDIHLSNVAADGDDGSGVLEYLGAPAGPAGLAVLDVGPLRIVADGARPSRLVEVVIDDASDAIDDASDPIDALGALDESMLPASGVEQLGIKRDANGAGVDVERAAALCRLAVAMDERARPDNVTANDWSVDVVVLADALGLDALAAREADVAATVLLGARARLAADAVAAARVVGRYTSVSTTVALHDLVAADEEATIGEATAAPGTGVPALARRDGEHRQRVAGAVAVHPRAVAQGIAFDRRGRLVWQPAEGRLRIELDVVGPPSELWLRVGEPSGVIVAIAPLAADGPAPVVPASLHRWTAVAELVIGGHNDLTTMVVEVTGDPSMPMASTRSRATAEAIADGREAASAARLGRWAAARDAWLRCARAWSRADDTDRQALALVEAAAAFDHLGDAAEASATRQRAAGMTTTWADVERPAGAGDERPFVADGLSH